MTIRPARAKVPYSVGAEDQAPVYGVVERLDTHMPADLERVAAAQPAADLSRRPTSGEFLRHDLAEGGIAFEHP